MKYTLVTTGKKNKGYGLGYRPLNTQVYLDIELEELVATLKKLGYGDEINDIQHFVEQDLTELGQSLTHDFDGKHTVHIYRSL